MFLLQNSLWDTHERNGSIHNVGKLFKLPTDSILTLQTFVCADCANRADRQLQRLNRAARCRQRGRGLR